ncbi:hypothetical protein KIH74_07660 [Kineosporia sp. J2-2]|uniref:ABC-2 type transport system permease protein n=1 Tax=Kineosporia corallincola TaxID=2835133 RepID=A0ABS5TCJ2_9ACTN|nr:DUF6297 family protein [Kineosporia corallincola]MBT0768797.1 hypothetical protein [Kineosporia corallincola]
MSLTGTTTRLPTGRAIRRWTRDAGRRRAEAGLGELFNTIYTAVFAVALAASMIFSLSSGLGQGQTVSAQTTDRVALATGWLVTLPAIAVLAAFAGIVTRLGPLSLSAPESTWWLPLAVERRGLLRASAFRWPAVGGLLGAVAGAAVGLAMAAGVPGLIGVTLCGAALTVILVVLAGLAQTRPRWHHAIRVGADLALGAVPIAGVALALTKTDAPVPGGFLLPVALILAGLAIWLVRTWDARLADVPGVSLRARGAASDEALVAVLSMDPRGLGRALGARSDPPRRSRSVRMRWLARLPVGYRPVAAVITSDLLLFLRTPRHPAQAVIALCLPGLALMVPHPSRAAVAATLLIGAYVAAVGAVEGARRAQVGPGLDSAWPLSQVAVRLSRMVLPTAVMVFWFAAVSVLLTWRYGGALGWVTLGVLAAPGWAAAAVRSAYRPLPDFSGPTVSTPMGALPPGLSGNGLQGPDLAVVVAAPLVVALILGGVPSLLPTIQWTLTLIAVLLAMRPGSRAVRPPESGSRRTSDASEA